MHSCQLLHSRTLQMDALNMQSFFLLFDHPASMQDEPTNQVPPQERVAKVRPYWETLSHEQRVELLTLDVKFLHQRAVEVTTKTHKQLGKAFYLSSAENTLCSSAKLADSLLRASQSMIVAVGYICPDK